MKMQPIRRSLVVTVASCCLFVALTVEALPDANTNCPERYEQLGEEFKLDLEALKEQVYRELDCSKIMDRECVRNDPKTKEAVAKLLAKVRERGEMRGCSYTYWDESDIKSSIKAEFQEAYYLLQDIQFWIYDARIMELYNYLSDEFEAAWKSAPFS